METADLPEHVQRNREAWDRMAPDYAAGGRASWARDEPTWGIWNVPDADVHLLPDDLDGKDTIELGCGTAYISSWLARRGARPVGIDISDKQLQTARALQREFGLDFPLINGNAERVPLPDASFDFAVSEYGAAIWADPYAWIPEAARLLRPGGTLVVFGNSTLLLLCSQDVEAPAEDRLLRPQFGMHRFEWPDDEGVEFHLSHGDWIRLFRSNGFEVEDLVEIQAPVGATTRFDFVTPEWARKWPSEEGWKVRKIR